MLVDDQCRLYRNYLNNGTGLWQHIILGASGQDYGFWTTGNAWAAWGMLRVLVTMQHSEYREAMEPQKEDLKNWIVEILQASYPHTNVSYLKQESLRRTPNVFYFSVFLDDDGSTTQLSGRTRLFFGSSLNSTHGFSIVPNGTARSRHQYSPERARS